MTDSQDLRTSLGAAPIQRDCVRVSGPQAVEFLQGQLSQDVAALAVDESAPTFLLQPTGKVDAWLRVTRLGADDLLLDVDQGYGELVATRLRRFKLRTKADIDLERRSGLALRGPGADDVAVPTGAVGLRAGWPGVAGVDLLTAGELALAGVPLVERAAFEALRIECGVPAMGAELTQATIPAEAGAWLIAASVSFTKGCYTGQELVARIDSRGGNVPHPVRGLRVDEHLASVGATVEVGGTPVGSVTSAGWSPALGSIALAVIGRATPVGAVVDVGSEGGRTKATVAELPLR